MVRVIRCVYAAAPSHSSRIICNVKLNVIFLAFGFCEFGNPDAALRAIRMLHEMEIGNRKLVVKVDAKAQAVLEEYKGTSFVGYCWLQMSEERVVQFVAFL